ncbi:MAG TPA: 3-oxoadipate enol-lactonase [Micromonosporaceae bacterium]|jgi:3-oxoadipate enol-lactonase
MTDSFRLGFDDVGPRDAPVLLLGPSLGTNRRMWRGPAEALSGDFRVISYDLLGHGDSEVPAGPYDIGLIGRSVLALLDGLGVPTSHYAGVSLGGMIGMWLAVNAPERIDRLALVCTSAYLPEGNWIERAARVRSHGTASIADVIVTRWFTEAFRESSPGTVAEFGDMIATTPDEGYAACCEAIAAMDQRASLPSIRVPTLVISAEDDPSTPPPHGQTIAAAVPGAEFVVLHNASHLANVERADDVAALIAAFLEGR